MVTPDQLASIATHHWIRHDEPVFHAYLKSLPGTSSLCGDGKPFHSVRAIDVPGEHSKCCIKCCAQLYGAGFFGLLPPKERVGV